MDSLKILILSNLCPPYSLGGYEIACLEVAKYLSSQGYSIRLLTASTYVASLNDPEYVYRCFQLNEYSILPISNPTIARHQLFRSKIACFHNTSIFLDHLSEFKPDVILFYNILGLGGLALIDVVNHLKIPWVFHLMDKVPANLISNVSKEILGFYHAYNNELFQQGKYLSSKRNITELLSFNIDIQKITTKTMVWASQVDAVINKKYQKDNITRFIFSGYIGEHKGVDIVLQAAAILISSGISSFCIDLYGQGEIICYAKKIKELHLEAYCQFKGQVPHAKMQKLFLDYDCLLFPTWPREPFGFVVMQACVAGCVPMITINSGAGEFLVNGVHCIKVERSANEYARAMTKVIQKQINLQSIGKAAAYYVDRQCRFEFTIKKILDNLITCNKLEKSVYSTERIETQRRLQYLKEMRCFEIEFNN